MVPNLFLCTKLHTNVFTIKLLQRFMSLCPIGFQWTHSMCLQHCSRLTAYDVNKLLILEVYFHFVKPCIIQYCSEFYISACFQKFKRSI